MSERKTSKKIWILFTVIICFIVIVILAYALSNSNQEPLEPERIMIVRYRELDYFTEDTYFGDYGQTPFVRVYVEVENINCGEEDISHDHFKIVSRDGNKYSTAHWAIFDYHADWNHNHIFNGEELEGTLVFEVEYPVTNYDLEYDSWNTWSGYIKVEYVRLFD